MNSQIFRKDVSSNILYDLLNKICINIEPYFIFDKISYKRGEFMKLLEPFRVLLLDYYYISKHKYLTKKLTYTSFITIIRQICKFNNINYSSKIIYLKSKYEIVYHIHYSDVAL